MRKLVIGAFATLALSALAAQTALAADPSTVKIALLDMTALWGPGYGQSIGMMGQGGDPNYGPGQAYGMMGQGQGYGPGGGMMGQGYRPGPGQGNGMMGRGFMGMMSVRTNVTSVKAGTVTFDVSNLSRSLVHEIIVVAVENSAAPLPYDYATGEVPEKQVKVLGETEELPPNAEKTVALDLKPGSYLLICNVPGHYASGMWAPLTVTQ